MTPAETARLLQHIGRRWPHAEIPPDSGDVWHADLAAVPADRAAAAAESWALKGSPFPPTSGWVLAESTRADQSPAPGAADAQRLLSRLLASCAPHDSVTPASTAVAIVRLAERGVHEAVLRWVQAVGISAIRFMPDAAMHGLDPNQLADRRDRHRHYERTVLEDWRNDPRPGVALERACRAAELTVDQLVQLSNAAVVTRIDRPRALRALPAPPAADDERWEGVGPEQAMRLFRETAAANRLQRKLHERRAQAARDRDDDAMQAAERELAEHAARRESAEVTR